jgi:hypothetical protein
MLCGFFASLQRQPPAAYVVLLAQAARMHGPIGELLLQAPILRSIGCPISDIIIMISDVVKHFLSKSRTFLIFFLSPGDWHLAVAATGDTIPPCP